MVRLYVWLQTFVLRDARGVTAIEYALIAALVAVAATITLTVLGTSIDATFGSVNSALTGVPAP